MSAVGLTKAMRAALERLNRDASDASPAMRDRLHTSGLVRYTGTLALLTPRGHAALAAPRMTQAELAMLERAERDGFVEPPWLRVYRSCHLYGWLRQGSLTPAGLTALNNMRAAMGSELYKDNM